MSQETQQEYRKRMAQVCEASFSEHTLSTCSTGDFPIFRCGKPGTGHLHFYVAFLPGCIHVWGDIEGFTLRTGARGIQWLLRSRHSMGYILEKLQPVFWEQKQFFPGQVDEWLAEAAGEAWYSAPLLQDLYEAWREESENWEEHTLAQRWKGRAYDITEDCEILGSWDDWKPSILWGYYALCCFCRLYEDHSP